MGRKDFVNSKHSKFKNKIQEKSGQIIILFVMMLSTLVILIGMVISVGHLVQSKISLQNSVDLAAMSGASWQARYMNGISLVNYRMRQNYRWLLFDVYVTQSRFNGAFRDQVDGGGGGEVGSPEQVFGICQQSFGYQPAAFEGGRGTTDTTDMCKNALTGGGYIPPIIPSPAPSYNPIYIAINAAIIALSIEAQQICSDSANQNLKYFEYTTNRFAETNNYQASQFQKAVGNFDTAFSSGLSVSGASADDTMLSTFRDNLLRNLKSSGPTLMWLNPYSTRVKSMANFEQQDVRLFMNYVNFINSGGCSVVIERTSGRQGKVGYSLVDSGQNPVHVAISGIAQPKILFWPTGGFPVMTAIGVAKPFGSRVGPPKQAFEVETNSGMAGLANLFVKPDDNGRGMFQIDFLKMILGTFPARMSGRNPLRPSGGDFLKMVSAPTKFDALYYNPFPDSTPEYTAEALPGVGISNGSYDHEDGRSNTSGWHSTDTLGGQYYASSSDLKTSWGLAQGRQGYQIKLVSLPAICLQVEASKRGALENLFCTNSNLRIFH